MNCSSPPRRCVSHRSATTAIRTERRKYRWAEIGEDGRRCQAEWYNRDYVRRMRRALDRLCSRGLIVSESSGPGDPAWYSAPKATR